MIIVRPINADDWQSLRDLAALTGVGFTSLQDDDKQVTARLNRSMRAFDENDTEAYPSYLFLMEDLSEKKVVGVCGIETAIGIDSPWYDYHVGTLVHSSRELNIHNPIKTLTISNDFTGCTELCTLFLEPDYRKSYNGHLLSKSRLLFISEFSSRFSSTVMAELRGYSDENGVSPFWEGLGRHFFSLDFMQADRLSAHDKVFIAELMPKYPIYTNLLPEDARNAIGQTHEQTTPARKLLESEGFRYTNFVDIFDAGPVLEAQQQQIRIVRDSHYVKVDISEEAQGGQAMLVSNTKFKDFRCTASENVEVLGSKIVVQGDVADALQVRKGDTLRIANLFSRWRKA